MNGYLTENGDVNLERVGILLEEVGEKEDDIFVRRKERTFFLIYR